MNVRFKLCMLTGVVGLMAACAVAGPAQADDWYDRRDRRDYDYYRDDRHTSRQHIRNDVEDIRADYRRLHELERVRDRERRCRDYRDARRTEDEIHDLRRHIERDKRDVRRDFEDRRDRDWRR